MSDSLLSAATDGVADCAKTGALESRSDTIAHEMMDVELVDESSMRNEFPPVPRAGVALRFLANQPFNTHWQFFLVDPAPGPMRATEGQEGRPLETSGGN